jgi:hypothetical protein
MADAPDTLNEKIAEKGSLRDKDTFGDDEKIDTNGHVPLEKDGIALHPQPTSDPLDPLNWSSLKKHSILAIVMAL